MCGGGGVSGGWEWDVGEGGDLGWGLGLRCWVGSVVGVGCLFRLVYFENVDFKKKKKSFPLNLDFFEKFRNF